MVSRNSRKRQTVDISGVSAILRGLASQMARARAEAWLIEDLGSAIKYARMIKKDANTLLSHAEKLISVILEMKRPPLSPVREGGGGSETSSPQKGTAFEYCYRGKIKFGLAQKGHIVPAIYDAMKDCSRHEELGFFKVTIEEDVMRNIDPKKISNSIVDAINECQSEALQLSALPKRHRLHGLACNVLIADDQSSAFHVPNLEFNAGELELDFRELFHYTVQESSRCCVKPYLVIPTDCSPQWRESVGLAATPYVDCGARLNMTSSRIPGIHTAYEYFSTGPGSCTAMHVEDGFLGSMNFVLAGAPKVWLFVQPRYRRKLEMKAREHLMEKGESYSCSQFVRHLNKLLSPQVLDSWEVPYHIVSCKAGEMIITLPETYHQVVNAGANYAEAINFAAEQDWTGPSADYEFCTSECNHMIEPITAAQLRVQENTLSPNSVSNRDEQIHSFGNVSEDSSHRGPGQASPGDVDALQKGLEEFVDETLRSDMPESPKPTVNWPSFPPTPADPTSDDSLLRNASPAGREKDQNVCQNRLGRGISGDRDHTEVEALIDTRAGENVAEILNGKDDNEVDARKGQIHNDCGSSAATKENFTAGTAILDRDESHIPLNQGIPNTSIEIGEDGGDDSSNLIEVPLTTATRGYETANESIEIKIDRLLEQAVSFLPALEISKSTLERFRLGQQLNDEAILKTLEIILPDKAAPLIASFAIKNFPSSGLATDFTGAEIPQGIQPQLVHDTDSTHLFIAYNVQAHSLQHAADGSGNHWILIVVDFLTRKIHLFGAEKGLETRAVTITWNIGAFINSFRLTEGCEQINWTGADVQPLYQSGSFPDNYNCGVAVISRAETFIYPDKDLGVSDRITPTDLSRRLDELRAVYLECIIRRCSRVCDDEAVSAQLGILTPDRQSKKRSSPFPTPDGKKILVVKSAFQRRSDASIPILETIPRSEVEQWKDCIFRTAQNTGFDGACLVETFERFPNNALDKSLRLLQCVCEVANQDRLFQVKDALQLRMQPLLEQSPSEIDVTRLANLHFSINKFAQVTYVAQYQRYMGLALYYQWFQSAVQLRSQHMRRARNERKSMAHYVKNGSKSQLGPPSMHQNDLLTQVGNSSRGSQAQARLKEELVDLLVRGNKDRDTARKELDRNIREGKILNLLLSPLDNRSPRTDIRFLCLFPLYDLHDPEVSRPSFDLMAHSPPNVIKKLQKPISGQELVKFNESLAGFFGKHLFNMRPELSRIDANYLPGGNVELPGSKTVSPGDKETEGCSTIYLDLARDEELREVRPMDVARFFEPVKKAFCTPRQLAFR